MSSVTPASSSHLPRKSSPKKGLRGFFSLPYCSLRLAYCCFNVVKNHLRTRSALFAGSDSLAGAAKTGGCSHQYELNSVKLVPERMKGGAVRLARSPLKEAMDCQGRKSQRPIILCAVCLRWRGQTLRKAPQLLPPPAAALLFCCAESMTSGRLVWDV